MECKYKIGDKVVKSWQRSAVGEVVDIIIHPDLSSPMYRAKFPTCIGTFLEGDLSPAIIADSVAGDKIQTQ